jgi:hypothetical protein
LKENKKARLFQRAVDNPDLNRDGNNITNENQDVKDNFQSI